MPGFLGLPPVVVGLLVLCLILGAGYLGWRQAVQPAAPARGLPPARSGLLASVPSPAALYFAGVDMPGGAAGPGAAVASPAAADATGGAVASPAAAAVPGRAAASPATPPVAADKPGGQDAAERVARVRRAAEVIVAARGGSRRTDAFAWPVLAPVSSPFGPRWGRHHNGIDLAAEHGDVIRASRAGDVWLAGEVEGYGLTVVIGHDDGTRTLYAHASALLVTAGQRVEQGQPIARVGSTGRSTGPHLHFEIIVDDRPVNPLDYLPPQP